MAAAGGMAKEGLVPFATTYAVFGTRRAYDFIHQVIAEENLNVKICCALPGLTTGYGPSQPGDRGPRDDARHPGPDDRRSVRRAGHRAGRAADRGAQGPGVHAAAARPGAAGARRDRGLPLRAGQGQDAARGRRRAGDLQRPHDDARAGGGAGPGRRTMSASRCCTARPSSRWTRRRSSRRCATSTGWWWWPRTIRWWAVWARRWPARCCAIACSRRASSWPGCPTPSSTPARCPRCTTATASAARRWAARIKGWLG